MKIKFLYIENGKITLTRQELEQLLEESYQDGVAEGRKSNNSGGLTYQPSETKAPDYYNSPYWGIDRAIPVTCNDPNVVKISTSGDPLSWTSAGTVTITGNCADHDCVYSMGSTSSIHSVVHDAAKTYTDTANDTISARVSTIDSDICGSTLEAYTDLYTHSDPSAIAGITSVEEE